MITFPHDLFPRPIEGSLEQELFFYLQQLRAPYAQWARRYYKPIRDVFIESYATDHSHVVSHHATRGGLLQHTVETMRIAWCLFSLSEKERTALLHRLFQRYYETIWSLRLHSEKHLLAKFEEHDRFFEETVTRMTTLHFSSIDKDVVLLTLFLHDSAKVIEHPPHSTLAHYFPWSFQEELPQHTLALGHVSLGLAHIYYSLRQDPSIRDGTFVSSLLSAIAAHHGKKEWGAPITPSFPEAYVVHFADYISGKWGITNEID